MSNVRRRAVSHAPHCRTISSTCVLSLNFVLASALYVVAETSLAGESLTIVAKNDDALEIALRKRVEFSAVKYSLDRWLYTKKILIDKNSPRPHSNPVLTLSVTTKFPRDDMELVEMLLHEEFHWHVALHSRLSETQLIQQLKKVLSPLRSAEPYGSGDEASTYVHVLVCFMEYKVLSNIFGRDSVRSRVSSLGFYTDIYAAVLDQGNNDAIEAILGRAGVRY